MWTYKTDKAILKEIGEKIKRERVELNLTQEDIALRSGISLSSVQRIERGISVSIKYLISVMRVLEMLEQFSLAFPEKEISPIKLMKLQEKKRKRADKR